MSESTNSDLNEISITELWEKINEAREWALDHFTTKEAENTNLIDPETEEFRKPSFFVEFPEPDQMIATPSFLGRKGIMPFHYRLSFCLDGTMEWKTKHPIYGTPIPPLKVK